jgi:hypothetical protein
MVHSVTDARLLHRAAKQPEHVANCTTTAPVYYTHKHTTPAAPVMLVLQLCAAVAAMYA